MTVYGKSFNQQVHSIPPDEESHSSCADVVCRHGSVCKEVEKGPRCFCDLDCQMTSPRHGSGNSEDIVCGTDGQNYGSECELRMFACRLDQNIEVDHRGACRGNWFSSISSNSFFFFFCIFVKCFLIVIFSSVFFWVFDVLKNLIFFLEYKYIYLKGKRRKQKEEEEKQ